MKIAECTNAPQWLKDAKTENEDVEILAHGWVRWNSGTWNSGYFLRGYFLGGEFRGGEFRGGYFLGGEFRGGKFLGGEFRGGYFLGGEFRGGKFLGGYFLGGEFRGGKFRGVKAKWSMCLGDCEGWTKVLIASISGVAYIHAGCRWFTLKEAKKHWESKRDRRPFTLALMLAATEICKIKGLKESEDGQ